MVNSQTGLRGPESLSVDLSALRASFTKPKPKIGEKSLVCNNKCMRQGRSTGCLIWGSMGLCGSQLKTH